MTQGATGFFTKEYLKELLVEAGREDLIPSIEEESNLLDPEFQYTIAQLSIAVALDKFDGDPGDIEVFRRMAPNKQTGELEERSFLVDLSDQDEKDFFMVVENDLENIKESGELSKIVEYLDKIV